MSTINLTVGASSDDAHSTNSGLSYDHTASHCRSDSGDFNTTAWCSGVRFTNVLIERSDGIVSAILSVYVQNILWDDPDLVVGVEAADDAATFSAQDKPKDRTSQYGRVDWEDTSLGVGYQSPPNITFGVTQATNLGGWSSGNALAVILRGNIGGVKEFRYRSFDYGDSGMYAKLEIDYTSGGPLPVIMDHYKRMRS